MDRLNPNLSCVFSQFLTIPDTPRRCILKKLKKLENIFFKSMLRKFVYYSGTCKTHLKKLKKVDQKYIGITPDVRCLRSLRSAERRPSLNGV